MHQSRISRIRNRKAVVRLAALVVLLVAMMGPWIIDNHPATKENCTAPLVYHGDGLCACLISLPAAFLQLIKPGQSIILALIFLLPTLPFFSTAFLMLGKGQRSLWIFHLAAWGLTSALSLLLFFGIWLDMVFVWGAGLGGLLSVSMLTGELLAAKSHPDQES
ncbi:MAG: hypothetical protein JW862_16195 [Anaerolineales bacterium]|nr:hypothetical protein [Anaerolineales bacterium]